MKRLFVTVYAALAVMAAMLILVPAKSNAQMECAACHDIHNSAGGTLNTAAEFDLICDTCHGPAGTAIFADRHVDPAVNEASGNTGKPAWEMGCITCHTPHRTDAVNHLYNNGTPHDHALGGDSTTAVDGINIKLFGRNEDGTGIAKIATPLRINDVDSAGPCTNSNIEVEVFLPPFSDGEGPPAIIMVGDRITINNGGAEFDGTFRVKETNWDGIQNTTPTGWVCFDRQTTAVYDPTGFVRSMGWHARPKILRVDWDLNTAELILSDSYSIRVGDSIGVSGLPVGEFNGVNTVTGVTSTSVTAASWSALTATLTLAENHLYQVGEYIVVSDLISTGPGSFDGEYQITIVNGQDVSYALATDPGTYTNNGSVATPTFSRVTYTLPPDQGSGATTFSKPYPRLEYVGSIKSVQGMVVITPPSPPPILITGLSFTAARRSTNPDVVVLTVNPAHTFQTDDVFTVSGINPDDFNGTWIITDGSNSSEIEFQHIWDPDPPAYISGGVILPPQVLDITLANSDTTINQFQAATSGVRDGDIITVFGADPDGYNGRWEVETVVLPIVTVRCPPYFRTALAKPGCSLAGLPAYISGGDIQSTGTMRPVVFESRGTDNSDTDFLSDYTHSFTNTDEDEDGWMDGPCETCHTDTANHKNDDFGNTHNNGRTCTASCHTHSTGFDKDSAFCPPGRPCPPVN
ncbi:MAG: hypothetical protein V3R81_15035 [Gammaproteobacteria bacterium]